ncbi:Uu.00g085990.m01.CDS01 [Anthostomella pinea]|uniref:Uu.00g085990.m01.CDS01 n=1 Tax=Anthostomella pinea TaxID=933095 RepID=A0AAI8YJZ7_9PEZI|nr:Uu.00g085990.m01.CDS01 [Anthostomella pinea]
MGSTLSVVKTLIIPAVISLILFLVSTFVLVPLWRRYRSRYSQYLPLESISNRTSSVRARVQDAMARWLIPSRWRVGDRLVIGGDTESDQGYSSEDGEELDDVIGDHHDALSPDTRNQQTDSMRRLSRDLEEGFRDDSDEEENDERQRRR